MQTDGCGVRSAAPDSARLRRLRRIAPLAVWQAFRQATEKTHPQSLYVGLAGNEGRGWQGVGQEPIRALRSARRTPSPTMVERLSAMTSGEPSDRSASERVLAFQRASLAAVCERLGRPRNWRTVSNWSIWSVVKRIRMLVACWEEGLFWVVVLVFIALLLRSLL